MTVLYRIFSLIINVAAIMLAISFLGSFQILISSPQTLLSGFMMLAVILYSWFSFRFRREVLQLQKTVSHSLRDWTRVNGIVTLFFSIITILSTALLVMNPAPFFEALRNFSIGIPEKTAINFIYGMLLYAVVLFVHILWTFALMKKHREFFQ